MHDLLLMQRIQSIDHLIEDAPDVFLLQVPHGTLVLVDLGLQVAAICVFHDDAEGGCALLEEGLFVAGYVLMINGG